MLYERFFQWLTFHKRRHCKHEEDIKIGTTMIEFGYFNEYREYNIFKCTNCGKKKKRPVEGRENRYIMM